MPSRIEKTFSSFSSAAFSPCGGYLAISDRCGDVFVHKLSNLARTTTTNAGALPEKVLRLRPLVTISDSNNSANAQLLVWRDFLLCCFSNGQVDAYRWTDLAKQRATSAWGRRFNDAKRQGLSSTCEFLTWKTLSDSSGRDLLFAGSASTGTDQSCPILCWEFEGAKLINSYSGHTNSVYCVSTGCKSNSQSTSEFMSAGEDGDVRVWDVRVSSSSVAVMKPVQTDCARPGFGKWVGCLATDGDWMVCGGGPQLGLWHVGSRTLVKPMTTNGTALSEHYCGTVVDDRIITGGSGGNILHWNYRGDSMAVMPATPNFVYDLQYNATSGQQILAAVGSGSLIELYSHLVYRMAPLENIL